MKYKYGVEYETNGKKPDLPGDVRVEICQRKGWQDRTFNVKEVDFELKEYNSDVMSFRIVDERYKPANADSSTSIVTFSEGRGGIGVSGQAVEIVGATITKHDNSWYECGENPPPGTDCDYTIGARPRKSCTFVGINSRGSVVIEDCNGEYKTYHSHQINLHPIKTELEKFQDSALELYDDNPQVWIHAMFKAGFRAPDEKSRI